MNQCKSINRGKVRVRVTKDARGRYETMQVEGLGAPLFACVAGDQVALQVGDQPAAVPTPEQLELILEALGAMLDGV